MHDSKVQGRVFFLREPKRRRQLRHSRKGLGTLKSAKHASFKKIQHSYQTWLETTYRPIDYNSLGKILRIVALLKGLYKGPYSTPPAAKVETKNHHKTMKIEVPEAEILRTLIKIEKLSLWNRSRSGFIMHFEFHGFQ